MRRNAVPKSKRSSTRAGGTNRARAVRATVDTRAPLPPGTRRRMPREMRERAIIAEGIRLFAECGLQADMRELARRLHITHPALFRYFPTKDALIDRVYQETFVGRWNPEWEVIIRDRTLPLEVRLVRLYRMYSQLALSYEWVRLYMFAGLNGLDAPRRFYGFIEDRLIVPICEEVREAFGLPNTSNVPVQILEKQLVWSFHSQVFYLGIRKHILGMKIPENIEDVLNAEVSVFLGGIGPTLTAQLKEAERGYGGRKADAE